MDFGKAFNKVGHMRPPAQIHNFGITGINNWTKNCPADHTQVVVI